nr:MAG TPA: hypothetical protein [Caudoviricetes sp.]
MLFWRRLTILLLMIRFSTEEKSFTFLVKLE